MAKTVSLKEAQATYSISLDKADLEQGPLILEHEGEPVAAIISIEDYQRFVAGQDYDTWRQEQLQSLQPEREAFRRLLPDLLKTYEGQFVAIHDGQVVDVDKDSATLARRTRAQGHRPVYIQKVMKEPRIVELPSPEVISRAPL